MGVGFRIPIAPILSRNYDLSQSWCENPTVKRIKNENHSVEDDKFWDSFKSFYEEK